MQTTIHRETLYCEVWEEPISKLAKRYNISDVALAKICRKLQVPIPPRGYWARIQHGYKVTRPRLPKVPTGTAETATISPVTLRSHELREAVQEQKAFEADPAHRISVETDRKLHPLVIATRAMRSGKTNSSESHAPLDVNVGKASLDRALRILSALIYAFEERGFTVEAAREKKGSVVVVKGEPLQFSLEEQTKRITVPPSKNRFYPTYEYEFTGKLIFRIHDYWAQGHRKNWSDGVRRPLEEQLNDIIPVLVDLSLIVREKRQDMERMRARFKEESRLQALAEQRSKQIESDLQRWQTAMHYRALIEHVSSDTSPEEKNRPELIRWLGWANRLAAKIDPLTDGVEVFLAKYPF